MNQKAQSDSEIIVKAFLILLGIILMIAFLAMPITGDIAGVTIQLPMIGWMIGILMVIFVIVLYFKK